MKIIEIEKIVLTSDEYSILKDALQIIDDIYKGAVAKGDIESMSCSIFDNLCNILSDEYSEVE